jgi:hypothetical protein
VVAVLRDRPSDVTVAHHAARRAQRESRGLVLVVPLPVGRRAARRDAAAAIAGRVQPELAKIGEVASVHLATYVDSPDRRRRERRILAAVNRTTARLRAAVVLSAADSLTRLPARIDYEPADQMPAAGRETERVSPLPSHRCPWPCKSPHWWPGLGPRWWPVEVPTPRVSCRRVSPAR